MEAALFFVGVLVGLGIRELRDAWKSRPPSPPPALPLAEPTPRALPARRGRRR
jgi:hypothetical protein